MGYDIGILICSVFILLTVFVGLYATYAVVFSATENLFEDSVIVKNIFRIVCFPIGLCFVFFFLSFPILFLAAAIQLSFHGH